MGLEEEAGVDVSGEVLSDELLVLSARLGTFSFLLSEQKGIRVIPRLSLSPNGHSNGLK